MNHIFIHPDVTQVRHLHSSILSSFDLTGSILELLDLMATNLYQANATGDTWSQVEINNYLDPAEFSQEDNKIRIDLKAARELMTRQHGFNDWKLMKFQNGRISTRIVFWSIDAILPYGKR
jgi:hypothetical protein